MNYLFLQYFCLINIHFKSFSLSYAIDKGNNIVIDDFIRKLLTSQKFDELADKIAEKAVYKIKKFEQGIGPKPRRLGTKNYTKLHEALYRHRDKHQGESSELVKEASRGVSERPKNKYSKINVQAFMKKDASAKAANLSLKYKYLTQNAKKITANQDKDTDLGSAVLRNRDDLDKNDEENEKINSDGGKDDKSQYRNDETSHEKLEDKSIVQEDVHEENEKPDHHSYKSSLTNIYHKDDEELEEAETETGVDAEYVEVTPEGEPNENATIKKAKRTTKESETTTGKSQNEEENTEIIEPIDEGSNAEEDSDENKVTKDVQKYVRREGDKTFVFNSSPDYKDYHEEYELAHKEKPENVLF